MARRISEQGGEQRTPLKGCVRVRSPYTAEQCSRMFVVRRKCSSRPNREEWRSYSFLNTIAYIIHRSPPLSGSRTISVLKQRENYMPSRTECGSHAMAGGAKGRRTKRRPHVRLR